MKDKKDKVLPFLDEYKLIDGKRAIDDDKDDFITFLERFAIGLLICVTIMLAVILFLIIKNI